MDRRELMDLLRLHTDLALFGLVGGLGSRLFGGPITVILFLFTGVSAILSARAINIGHSYYRAARDRRAALEELLAPPVRFGTTRTQRGEPPSAWPKVNTITILLHALIAAMAFGAAVAYAWAR